MSRSAGGMTGVDQKGKRARRRRGWERDAPEDTAEEEAEASDDIPESSAPGKAVSSSQVNGRTERCATHTCHPTLKGLIFHHRFCVSRAKTRPANTKHGAPTTCTSPGVKKRCEWRSVGRETTEAKADSERRRTCTANVRDWSINATSCSAGEERKLTSPIRCDPIPLRHTLLFRPALRATRRQNTRQTGDDADFKGGGPKELDGVGDVAEEDGRRGRRRAEEEPSPRRAVRG